LRKKDNHLKIEMGNPFLTKKADKLWDRLKRANLLKAKAHS
jgi:hypothetical protein